MKDSKLFERRRRRIRHHLKKRTPESPRLSVFRSTKHIYAQLIDDAAGKTIASASTLDKDVRKDKKPGSTVDAARKVGTLIAERGVKAKVKDVVFDRSGYLYHGRVKALAEGAREGGLTF